MRLAFFLAVACAAGCARVDGCLVEVDEPPRADMTCPALADVGDPNLDTGPTLEVDPPRRGCCYSGKFLTVREGLTEGTKCMHTSGTATVARGDLVTTPPPACPEGDDAVRALRARWAPDLIWAEVT